MVHRLTLFITVVGLLAFAACAVPTEPGNALRPSLDGGACDTLWVHPDSVPEPNQFSDDDGCHVVLPWEDQLRSISIGALNGGPRRNRE